MNKVKVPSSTALAPRTAVRETQHQIPRIFASVVICFTAFQNGSSFSTGHLQKSACDKNVASTFLIFQTLRRVRLF